MAEWVKAAEVQLTLHRWMTSQGGERWLRHWISAEAKAAATATHTSDETKAHMYRLLGQVEPYKLLSADAIWVSPEICDVVEAARRGFKPESMEREDFIVHTGFLYFAKPLYTRDRNGNTCSVGAISWCPIKIEGDADPEPETVDFVEGKTTGRISSYREEAASTKPDDRWGMSIALYSSAYADEDDFAVEHRDAMRNMGACELVPLHFTVIEFGDTLDEGQLYDLDGRYTGADEWWQLVQSCLRMMQQRIAVRVEGSLDRASRRRWEREGKPPPEVLIIRLRRPASPKHDGEPSTVNWTHQWIVDGFWRDQWYPSLQMHRQIYISPYVKGPADKPLVVKKRFYKWDR